MSISLPDFLQHIEEEIHFTITSTKGKTFENLMEDEILKRADLLPRAWEIARQMKKQSPLTLRYTRMVLSQRFRRRLQEGLSYGLALEGISAAQVAHLMTK